LSNVNYDLSSNVDITLSRLLGDDSDEFLSFLVNKTNLPLNTSAALLESTVNVSLCK